MKIAIIGFGEVGSIFARDLKAAGIDRIAAYDIAFADADSPQQAKAAQLGVTLAPSAVAAVAEADLVFVAVTAGGTLAAMRSLDGGLGHHPFVVDVNSVAPGTKREAAEIVEDEGGRYVEAAVMTSVPPQGIRSPMLLGGPHVAAFMAWVQPFDMKLTAFADTVGPASSVKMCRSVMIKGLEALTTECMLTARHYGVEDYVLRSLADTLPHPNWPGLARYVISRALLHGKRRAEEMREVARTVADAGIEPTLSLPIAARQDWAWQRAREMPKDTLTTEELPVLLDALLAVARKP